ncbi:DUF1624 domain-containing protein [Pedomonas mirosovicensis]|uniref:DUF1624 domain-containing protein n=1 Tax=Pedomonas mirosovicensis TaxID=2908641 RepID=UPI002169C850|nr:heparan-alpha-glucosaminide N-acetyltransferase domain-containing protein [Pedomonas mirosovicensis]MCH8685717.1 heparan-alpha-glucosaminide N-acetyltransferase domain-containing protein [Pedomonas mirosovicensis]
MASSSAGALTVVPSISAAANAALKSRVISIDALRGLVMLLMLVDHVREYFFIHAQVSDPVDLSVTPPALFFTRLTAHLCAPVFVALTGLSAWLYGQQRGGPAAASAFLLKRGLFLILLEVTLVNFAWTFSLTPSILYLQVIWAIGLSMVALAGLLWLPRAALIAVGLGIVFLHNLLGPIAFAPGEPGHVIWAILHDRGLIDLPWGGQARTSYPLLPWIGVIALGYAIGPWFARGSDAGARRQKLYLLGALSLLLFGVLRAVNIYGEPLPWSAGPTALHTVMSFLNLTKYPPSLDFLLLTLGVGALILGAAEKAPPRVLTLIATFGTAPLFFYLAHLYALHLLNLACLALFGPNQGAYFSLPNVATLWLLAAIMAVPLWFACRWFARLKKHSGRPWMSYL